MKMLMTMLAISLVFVGCSDADEPVVPVQEEEVVSDVAEETDEEVVSDVDSEEDVLTLDVEQEDSEVSVEEGPDVSEEEPEQLDEDPTSFRSNPDPGSHFFNPEVP